MAELTIHQVSARLNDHQKVPLCSNGANVIAALSWTRKLQTSGDTWGIDVIVFNPF